MRPPQFPADKGGQFTATVNHDLDDGSLLVWGRVLDDKNQFIVPVPVIENGSGASFLQVSGLLCAQVLLRQLKHTERDDPDPAGGFENANLANGRGGNLYYFGIKYDQHFGDWELMNNLILDGGGLDTNALFSGPNPRPLGYLLYGCQIRQPAGYCNGTTPTGGSTVLPSLGS